MLIIPTWGLQYINLTYFWLFGAPGIGNVRACYIGRTRTITDSVGIDLIEWDEYRPSQGDLGTS